MINTAGNLIDVLWFSRKRSILLLPLSLCACLPDELKFQYDWLDPGKYEFGSSLPLEDLFPGHWNDICISKPGEQPIRVVEKFAPKYKSNNWIKDGRFYDSDFTTTLFKIVLLNEDGFKICMMNQNIAEFKQKNFINFEKVF